MEAIEKAEVTLQKIDQLSLKMNREQKRKLAKKMRSVEKHKDSPDYDFRLYSILYELKN